MVVVGDKKAFKKTKRCRVIAIVNFVYLKVLFAEPKKSKYLIFHFLFTLRITKNIKFLKMFSNFDHKFAIKMY